MGNGGYGDIWTWVHDEDIQEKIFRVWLTQDCRMDNYLPMYFSQIIELPNGEILVGLRRVDYTEVGKANDCIIYKLLSQIQFVYCPDDQQNDLE